MAQSPQPPDFEAGSAGADGSRARPDEDLFVVAGLETTADDDLAHMGPDAIAALAAGPAGSFDLDIDASGVFAHGDDVEIELAAAAGETVAVEPPVEALGEIGDDEEVLAMLEDDDELAPVLRPRFRPWMAAGLAAALVLAVGAVGGFFLQNEPAAPIAPVAVLPPVAPAPFSPFRLDPACATSPTESFAATPTVAGMPSVAEPAESVRSLALAAVSTDPPGAPPIATDDPVPAPLGPVAVAPTAADPAASSAAADQASRQALSALGRGAMVLIRLRNGNVFDGRLARFDEASAKLSVPKGEIELLLQDVDTIVPMVQGPQTDGPEAVVQLVNGNRIAGRLAEERETEIALSLGSARIGVPRAAIASVELRSAAGLILGGSTKGSGN